MAVHDKPLNNADLFKWISVSQQLPEQTPWCFSHEHKTVYNVYYIWSTAGLQNQTLTRDEGDPYLHAPKGGEENEVKKFCTNRWLLVRGHGQWTPSNRVRAAPFDHLLRPGDYASNKKATQTKTDHMRRSFADKFETESQSRGLLRFLPDLHIRNSAHAPHPYQSLFSLTYLVRKSKSFQSQ